MWLPAPQAYNSLMEVNDSDHKPVYAMLNVHLPWYQQQQRRRSSLQALWQVAAAAGGGGSGAVALQVQPGLMQLQGSYLPAGLVITRPGSSGHRGGSSSSGCCCRFAVLGSGPGGALPSWLEVQPAAGLLEPGGSVTVRVQGTKAQWGVGTSCELRVLGCSEGSADSSEWPAAAYGCSTAVTVVL